MTQDCAPALQKQLAADRDVLTQHKCSLSGNPGGYELQKAAQHGLPHFCSKPAQGSGCACVSHLRETAFVKVGAITRHMEQTQVHSPL